MDGEHADTSHRGDDNVMVQGNFCGGGVPGGEPVPKERRQRIRARLNGLENSGKEGEWCSSLQRNTEQSKCVQKLYTEHAQQGLPEKLWARWAHDKARAYLQLTKSRTEGGTGWFLEYS